MILYDEKLVVPVKEHAGLTPFTAITIAVGAASVASPGAATTIRAFT